MSTNYHRFRRALALALVLGAVAIPVSASAQPVDPPAGINAGLGPSDSSQPVGGADYSSVNSITGASNESSQPGGSQDVGSGYSSLNAITGPTEEPTFVSGPPSDTADGFDWASAGIGAGAGFALTMIGLGGLLVLSNRRHRAEQLAPTA